MCKYRIFLFSFSLFFSLNLVGQDNLFNKFETNQNKFKSLIKNLDYDKIPFYLNEALSISKEINKDSIFVKVYAMHAQFYEYTSQLDKATEYLIKAAKMYDKIGNKRRALLMYNNLAAILYRNKQYQKVLEIRKDILKKARIEKDYRLETITLINLVSVYSNLNKLDSSLICINQGLRLAKKNKLQNYIGAAYSIKQNLFIDIKRYKESLKYGDTIERLYKNTSERGFYEHSLSYSATALSALGRFEESIVKSNLAIDLYKKNKLIELLPSIYNNLSSTYEANKNYKKALEIKLLEINLNDSILGIEKQKAIAGLEEKYQNEKKEKENLKLKQESALKDLTISNKNITILWSFLAFIMILFFLISYQLRKSKKNNLDLQNALDSQSKLEKKLTSVRNNIAQDFHDDLGNKLARISIFSQLLSKRLQPKDEKEKTMLSHISIDTNYLYKGTRDFIFSLKTESDYIEELATYLSDFGEDYYREFEIEFEIEKQIDENHKLPYYWSKQLIYIFKEAMTNVTKHAKADKVRLSFKLKNNELEIKCSDNGIGFNIDDLKKINGLNHMKERSKKIGGSLSISSEINLTNITFRGNIKNI